MSVTQTLYTGVTGLTANSENMSVIANNIANANSRGFKRDRAEFYDLISGGLGAESKVGQGARIGNIKTLHTQGALQITNNLTDLAIQGEGFFSISKPGGESGNEKYFTRLGSLGFDKEGFFSDSSGGRVQGYMADVNGQLSSRLSDISFGGANLLPPKRTDQVFLNLQLDSRMEKIEEAFDKLKPEATSNFNTAMSVYDSLGKQHAATLFFRKTESSEGASKWEWFAAVDRADTNEPQGEGSLKFFASGKVGFDSKGFLQSEDQSTDGIDFSGGALSDQKIEFDFGQNTGDEKGGGINTTTSIAAKSALSYSKQNGYETGMLKSIDIDKEGLVKGFFNNGVRKNLAAVALATFSNQDGLAKGGENRFISTIESGEALVGLAGSGSRGAIFSSTLEESNVDLAQEFVDMIRAQRMFQANSRSITTSDSMFEEVIGLKR